MRLVCLSDTHTRHEKVIVPDGDVLIHAGDICGQGLLPEVTATCRWLARFPHSRKLLVAGNHDWPFLRSPAASLRLCHENGIHYLEDSGIEIDGLNFWGSPWQPPFFNWAFNLPEPELAEKFALIPLDTHVLVTHGPPHGILDRNAQGVLCGSTALRASLEQLRPWLHVFGHIHEGYGVEHVRHQHVAHSFDTVCVNASTCTLQYRPTNPPIVVDVQVTDEGHWSVHQVAATEVRS